MSLVIGSSEKSLMMEMKIESGDQKDQLKRYSDYSNSTSNPKITINTTTK